MSVKLSTTGKSIDVVSVTIPVLGSVVLVVVQAERNKNSEIKTKRGESLYIIFSSRVKVTMFHKKESKL